MPDPRPREGVHHLPQFPLTPGICLWGETLLGSPAAMFMGIADPVQPFGFEYLVRGPPPPEFGLLDDALGEPVNLSGQPPQPQADSLQQAHGAFPAPIGCGARRR